MPGGRVVFRSTYFRLTRASKWGGSDFLLGRRPVAAAGKFATRRWVIAKANASVASARGSCSRPSIAFIIKATCRLSAAPRPTTVRFTSAGEYSPIGTAARESTSRTTPRAWPNLDAA